MKSLPRLIKPVWNLALTVLVLSAALGWMSEEGQSVDLLDQWQWENRVVLVSLEGPADDVLEEIDRHAAEIADRDIVWVVFDKDQVNTNFVQGIEPEAAEVLRRRFFAPEEKGAVLIGKDGGVKARQGALDWEGWFELIDQMPMRQSEMEP